MVVRVFFSRCCSTRASGRNRAASHARPRARRVCEPAPGTRIPPRPFKRSSRGIRYRGGHGALVLMSEGLLRREVRQGRPTVDGNALWFCALHSPCAVMRHARYTRVAAPLAGAQRGACKRAFALAWPWHLSIRIHVQQHTCIIPSAPKLAI